MTTGIFVSGIGLVSPLGATREKTWDALIQGKTGILKSSSGLEARVFDFSPNGARSRMGDFAALAAAEALANAGLSSDDARTLTIGCAVSQSKPLVQNLFAAPQAALFLDTDLLMSSFFGWSAEAVVQRELGLTGPSANLVAACATGVASIQTGERWIETGECEVALVGAAESSLNEFYRAGFRQMGVLAEESRGIQSARPFDKDRSGFVMGEGAAVLVLESEKSLRARGHRPVARLLRTALRQSQADILRFDAGGDAIAALIRQATGGFDTPGYINAHGTGTLFNDLAETRGIKKAFGKKARSIPVSSVKAATGHLLGAAGAVEAAVAALAVNKSAIPPTLNLETPDPECDLDYVPLAGRNVSVSSAMSLSYGFGGQMGAVLFGRAD